MENPTFHLEGVVRTREDMEDFEGPLTLILQLLAKNKIEIQDIRISDLLEQYMAWLDEMKSMDLEVASEFVQMASHLVYIKARMLISAGEETSELEELIESLERLKNKDVYERLKLVFPAFGAMYSRGAGTMVKPPEYLPADKEYRYVHEPSDLLDAMARVLASRDAAEIAQTGSTFRFPERIVYSVTEKSKELMDMLRSQGSTSLHGIFRNNRSRTELVATFIALLELARDGNILIEGEGDDTWVSYIDDTEAKED